MTARVEIEVEERKKSLFVPLEAIFERDGRHVAYPAGRAPRRRARSSSAPPTRTSWWSRRACVRGERVLLREPGAPPSDFGGVTTP